MGKAPRYVPKYLGTKLAKIRERLGVKTYEEMIARLDVPQLRLYRASILRYETGKLEPPSIVLLAYARLAGVTIEQLVDDELEITVK
jgi:transcriptional regulator with XRE-family HTH domain